jgi:hypothetical protein
MTNGVTTSRKRASTRTASPSSIRTGYASFTLTYDERGNVTETTYFGVDGKPTRNKDGCAKWTQTYDDRGNAVETAYFGLDGKPTLINEGYAKNTYIYDASGVLIDQKYWGVDGKASPMEVVVDGCVPGGIAGKLGLLSGDVIMRYGDSEVTGTDQFIELTGQGRQEDRSLVVRRDGDQLSFTVPPGKIGVHIQDRVAVSQLVQPTRAR